MLQHPSAPAHLSITLFQRKPDTPGMRPISDGNMDATTKQPKGQRLLALLMSYGKQGTSAR